MSAIVDFRLINKDKLSGLIDAVEPTKDKFLWFKWENDNYIPYLEKHTKELKDIDNSGYIYLNIISFFDEVLGVNLENHDLKEQQDNLSNKLQATVYLIPYHKKEELIKKINPKNISIQELVDYNIKLDDIADKDFANQQMDAIKVLHDNLNELKTEEQVLYFMIG
jgi:hypothetical protein